MKSGPEQKTDHNEDKELYASLYKELNINDVADTSPPLQTLLREIKQNQEEKERAMLKSLYVILKQFEEQHSKYPAKLFEIRNVRDLLVQLEGDIDGFNMMRRSLKNYLVELDRKEFFEIKRRIVHTIQGLSDDEIAVFTDFLSGGKKLLLAVGRIFTTRQELAVIAIERIDNQQDFADTLLGDDDIKDLEKIEEKMMNALKLLNLMIENRTKKK